MELLTWQPLQVSPLRQYGSTVALVCGDVGTLEDRENALGATDEGSLLNALGATVEGSLLNDELNDEGGIVNCNRCLSEGRDDAFLADGDDIEGIIFVTVAVGVCVRELESNCNGDFECTLEGVILDAVKCFAMGVNETSRNGLVLGEVKGIFEGGIDGLVLGAAKGNLEGDIDGLVRGAAKGNTEGDIDGLIFGSVKGSTVGSDDCDSDDCGSDDGTKIV